MNCKYFRTRTKTRKGIKKIYHYCTLLKKEISSYCCHECDSKEYKEYKPLKLRSNKLAKREKERFSIIYPDLTKCCVCGSKIGIEKNEVFSGSYRQKSIELGMVCPFCHDHHNRFHNDVMFNLLFKIMFEKEYLKNHTKEEFVNNFGQDYIYKLSKLEQKKRS